MKAICVLSLVIFSSVVSAVETLPKKITCTEERGYQLVIEDTGLESRGFQIPLEVSIVIEGQIVDFAVLLLQSNSAQAIRLEGQAQGGNTLTVWIDKAERTAFRQEAANGGGSPLPGMSYSDCKFE